MAYTVVLRDRTSGIVTSMSFDDKQNFLSWYDDDIKATDDILAEDIDSIDVEKYVNSPEARQAVNNLLTPEFHL